MGLGTALAVAQGVKTLGTYAYNRYKNNQRKKFGDSSLGKELKRIGEEGKYSQQAQNLITGDVARKSAGVAQTGKAGYAGRLAAQGLEGSVAGQRGMSEFDIQQQRDVAGASRKVQMENEASKVQAKLTFAEQKLRDEREREALQRQNVEQLIGGLGEAAGGLINAYYSDKDTKDMINNLLQMNSESIAKMIANKQLDEQTLSAMIFLQQLKEQEANG